MIYYQHHKKKRFFNVMTAATRHHAKILVLLKIMMKFMVCNVNDKKCKSLMATEHDWRIKIYSRICTSTCFAFYWGRSSHHESLQKNQHASSTSLQLQLIPKGIFKLFARKEICFLLFKFSIYYFLCSHFHIFTLSTIEPVSIP